MQCISDQKKKHELIPLVFFFSRFYLYWSPLVEDLIDALEIKVSIPLKPHTHAFVQVYY